MFAVHRAFLASFIVLLSGFCMPSYAEERFTSKDFLEWREEERASYIQISLITANTIASRNDPTQSTCIGDWYDRNKEGPLSHGSCRLVLKMFDGLSWAENGNERGLFTRAEGIGYLEDASATQRGFAAAVA